MTSALLNIDHAIVSAPVANTGRLVLLDDGTARLWAANGDLLAMLTDATFEQRNASQWRIDGTDMNGQPAYWPVDRKPCGCGG